MKKNRLFIKTKNKVIESIQDRVLVWLFYFFRLWPIQRNKIVITTFKNRGYCDSPKYIVNELLKRKEPYDFVWLCDNENPRDMPVGIRQVPYHSFRGIYEQVTAHIWIDNRRKSRYVRKREGQFYIQTWHGGIGLKNIEQAAESHLTKRYCQGAKNDSKMIDLFLSNSDFCTQIIRKDMWYRGAILQRGLPRSDVLLNGDRGRIERKVRDQYKIADDVSIVLYAPTFRADMEASNYEFPFKRFLNELERQTRCKWIMLMHFHTNIFSRCEENCFEERVLDTSNYEDVQELIIASQMLVSDYSSIIFDFALLNKPIIQYIFDLEDYLKDRAFNQSLEGLPFYKAHTPNEIVTLVRDIITNPQYDTYTWMKNKYGLSESGRAAEYTADVIIKKMKGEYI